MEINQQEHIRIMFTVTEGNDSFTDALYFTPAEYAGMTQEQIAALQKQRFDNWKAHIAAASQNQPSE